MLSLKQLLQLHSDVENYPENVPANAWGWGEMAEPVDTEEEAYLGPPCFHRTTLMKYG